MYAPTNQSEQMQQSNASHIFVFCLVGFCSVRTYHTITAGKKQWAIISMTILMFRSSFYRVLNAAVCIWLYIVFCELNFIFDFHRIVSVNSFIHPILYATLTAHVYSVMVNRMKTIDWSGNWMRACDRPLLHWNVRFRSFYCKQIMKKTEDSATGWVANQNCNRCVLLSWLCMFIYGRLKSGHSIGNMTSLYVSVYLWLCSIIINEITSHFTASDKQRWRLTTASSMHLMQCVQNVNRNYNHLAIPAIHSIRHANANWLSKHLFAGRFVKIVFFGIFLFLNNHLEFNKSVS